LVLGETTYAYGFGSFGTTVVFVTQPVRNSSGECVLEVPAMIEVATATGPFEPVPVDNAGTAVSYTVGAGQAISIELRATWAFPTAGATPGPCGDSVIDVARAEFPLASGTIHIEFGTVWREVCSSPPSVAIAIKN
jgi:hypothetical protein